MKSLALKLKEKCLKVTPQRLAIYNFLINTKEHPTAEHIYQGLVEQQPNLSLATVYKTLDVLKRSGLVTEISTGDDSLRYDGDINSHSHVVCQSCNKVMDYIDDRISEMEQEEILKSTGIKVNYKKLYFYGVCEECE